MGLFLNSELFTGRLTIGRRIPSCPTNQDFSGADDRFLSSAWRSPRVQRKQAKNDGRLPGLFLDPTHWNLPGILEPGDTLEPGTPQAQTSQAPVVGLKRADSRALVFGLLLSAAAMVFCCILYKYGFQAWFQEDDFAWL